MKTLGPRFLFVFLVLLSTNCRSRPTDSLPVAGQTEITASSAESASAKAGPIRTGAEQTQRYLPLLQGKRVGMVVNHTSLIGKTHLVDSLQRRGISITKIFAPEHGFRGDADAGAHISSTVDARTGIPIVSLYGKNYKPTAEQLQDLDVVVFDIQDVGVRFYTYISTMHYVMEACAENDKKLLILDRPNPNGHYVDGPLLDKSLQSFVGMHPIPVVHGLTVGELANMINGEKWLAGGNKADVQVIPCQDYTHNSRYSLPVKPSPNLPNDLSITLYPSLCFFEGTNVSVGRGTYTPFQIIGSPIYKKTEFTFVPKSIKGMSSQPPHENQVCYGLDLTDPAKATPFTLKYLIEFYQNSSNKGKFFNAFFPKLAGNHSLQQQIISGKSEAEIRKTWEPALSEYRTLRKRYLLYPDFS
ncbi:DUF1343 domain-containing protein [soil metagenome]